MIGFCSLLVSASILCTTSDLALFPNTKGTTWEYELDSLGIKGSMIQTIHAVKENSHETILDIRIESEIMDHKTSSFEILSISEAGVSRVKNSQGKWFPHQTLLPKNMDSNWTYFGSVFSNDIPIPARTIGQVIREESISTPIGKKQAKIIEIHTALGTQNGGLNLTSRYWYVQEIGWVKVENETTAGKVTLTLRKFFKPSE